MYKYLKCFLKFVCWWPLILVSTLLFIPYMFIMVGLLMTGCVKDLDPMDPIGFDPMDPIGFVLDWYQNL